MFSILLLTLLSKESRMIQVTQPMNFAKLGLYEYLLVAQPDNIISEKITAEKQRFAQEYQQKLAFHTKPHITVANFMARKPMEETIIRYTQRVCLQKQTFEVALNNYSGFPCHTIFVRIQDHQPFKKLATDLKVIGDYVDSCSCPPVKLITKPHLTICRHIPEAVYLKAMMDYSSKTFHETFMVKELVLLRRSSQYDSCKPVHVFHLQPANARFTENLYN